MNIHGTNFELVQKAFQQALDEGVTPKAATIEKMIPIRIPKENITKLLKRVRDELKHEEYFERRENTKLLENICILNEKLAKLYGVEGENKILQENIEKLESTIVKLEKELTKTESFIEEYCFILGATKLQSLSSTEVEKTVENFEYLDSQVKEKRNELNKITSQKQPEPTLNAFNDE